VGNTWPFTVISIFNMVNTRMYDITHVNLENLNK